MQEINEVLPLLDAIVSHLEDGVLICDRRGDVVYMNPAAHRLLAARKSDAPAAGASAVRNIANIKTVDLVGLMREAFYEEQMAATRPVNGQMKKFHREINGSKGGGKGGDGGSDRGAKKRQVEIRCCTTCEQHGRLRLFIIRDISRERRLTAVIDRAASELVTKDSKMIDILRRIDQVAPQQASILLQGESGTGKTHIARLIHRLSNRSDKPFIELNCAAIPETLLESELFGHIKGAFTGAISNRKGRFLAADGGTLFLDEVGEIPMHLQAKLLRAIQDKQFEPVGMDTPVQVDVRIISSSNRNLRDLVNNNCFRADLYYRLAVIPVHIPAVRERPGDIPLLLKHFCENMSARGYPGGVECSPEAMRLMMDYPWPGNVRELENAVEHAVICASNGVVVPESLPMEVRGYADAPPRLNAGKEHNQQHLNEQRQIIRDALKKARGNKTQAAELLGINRSTLWRRMRRYQVDA